MDQAEVSLQTVATPFTYAPIIFLVLQPPHRPNYTVEQQRVGQMAESINALLPVELVQKILGFALLHLYLPFENASLFDDMDVFVDLCKVHHYFTSTPTSLRLVCRRWNAIVQHDHDPQRIFFGREKAINTGANDSAQRVEIVNGRESWCRTWPCLPACRKNVPWIDTSPVPWNINLLWTENRRWDPNMGQGFPDAKVVRFLDNVGNPSRVLRHCANLEALWIHFYGVRTILQTPELMSVVQQQLTHLHLHKVYDDGNVYTLRLPSLVYLRLNLSLNSDEDESSCVFPLDIYMPEVTTIFLEGGDIAIDYALAIRVMILSCRETLVNLLISSMSRPSTILPLETLSQLPHLSAFGWSIDHFYLPFSETWAAGLEPTPISRINLILLDLESHHRCPYQRKLAATNCVEMVSGPGSRFSKIVLPLEWHELEKTWVRACERLEDEDEFDEDDPLPCAWSILEHIDQHDVTIEDRNGVKMREGVGKAFADRMRAYTASKTYVEKRFRKFRFATGGQYSTFYVRARDAYLLL
ncbi:hypothetical protein FRB91_002336 [Serendipita sp. 411]|nr:hypothetical protein FRB91_002336 [Serendipita sp. 411]